MLTIKKAMKDQKGFTLIELLVVVAIIALLASIILASLNTARAKGNDARRIADMKDIQTALELYYSNHNQYPTGSGSSVAVESALAGIVTDGDMSSVPDDPNSSYHYQYSGNSTGTTYCLGTILQGSLPEGGSATCPSGTTVTLSAPSGGSSYIVAP